MDLLPGWVALPGAIDAPVFALLVATSCVCSFITAGLGIGGGSLLLATMASLVPPAALIPVHGVVQLGSGAGRALIFLRWVHWPALRGFALGSLLGSVAGGLVAVELPPAVVEIGVGLFVIWTVAARPPRWLGDAPAVTGAVSSFLTMFFGATGLFVASYTRGLALSRQGFVATHGALMTVQHGLKVLVFGLLGFAYGEWGLVMLAMILAGGVGTALGRAFLSRTDDARFLRVLNVLLVLISLRLIWSGLADLL